MTQQTLSRYLNQYAEPEAGQLNGLTDQFQHCVCIPAYNEAPAFIDRLITFIHQQTATLAIIVLNRPDNHQHASTSENHKCQQALTEKLGIHWRHETIQLHRTKNQSAILLVDRFDKGAAIAAKQGVGMARKIAADIALQLILQAQISEPWIYSTDADVILPNNYFDRSDRFSEEDTIPANNIAAYILNYQHIAMSNEAINEATRLYEHRLNAYVDGLRLAGSPYAFQTLGSTLCLHANHYAMVRGFPKRAAGEDFYLLNKLRKTGLIVSLKTPTIQIESRLSHRTPFGTGSSVDDILANHEPQQAAIFYHPQLFVFLRDTLRWLEQLSSSDLAIQQENNWQQEISAYREWSEEKKAIIITALTAIDFNSGFTHCLNNSRDASQFTRQMNAWFDGFKTLKYLHALRDKNNLNHLSEQHYLNWLEKKDSEKSATTS
jgi:glycosyltransferase involved in cell wall biosynthesis